MSTLIRLARRHAAAMIGDETGLVRLSIISAAQDRWDHPLAARIKRARRDGKVSREAATDLSRAHLILDGRTPRGRQALRGRRRPRQAHARRRQRRPTTGPHPREGHRHHRDRSHHGSLRRARNRRGPARQKTALADPALQRELARPTRPVGEPGAPHQPASMSPGRPRPGRESGPIRAHNSRRDDPLHKTRRTEPAAPHRPAGIPHQQPV